MKTILTAALIVLISSSSNAGIVKDKESAFKLELANELFFTDETGLAAPAQVLDARVGKMVRMYRTDGFCYKGYVTSVEQADGMLKVYGTLTNVKDAQFGFALNKEGLFAGAVLEEDGEKVYVLELNPLMKGYVLVQTSKYNKPRS